MPTYQFTTKPGVFVPESKISSSHINLDDYMDSAPEILPDNSKLLVHNAMAVQLLLYVESQQIDEDDYLNALQIFQGTILPQLVFDDTGAGHATVVIDDPSFEWFYNMAAQPEFLEFGSTVRVNP
jgi:hypothetical protein